MTKHDVMRETGLPRTTVIRSLGELEKAGWASADRSSDPETGGYGQEEALEEVDAGVPATTPGQGQASQTGGDGGDDELHRRATRERRMKFLRDCKAKQLKELRQSGTPEAGQLLLDGQGRRAQRAACPLGTGAGT